MSQNSTPQQRAETIIRLMDDPVVALTQKETVKIVYHFVMYETYDFIENRIRNRKAIKHGEPIRDALTIANFKHELQEL